jgi:hypothetical protein
LARLPGIAQTVAWINRHIRLAGLATRSIKKEVLVMLLTWKFGL